MSLDANNNSKKIIVRARYNYTNKYIFLDDLCVENFLDEVKKVFQITANTIKVQLFDNIGANIPKEYFKDVVSQYQSSASFFVEVNVIEADTDTLIVSVTELKEFLIQEDECTVRYSTSALLSMSP